MIGAGAIALALLSAPARLAGAACWQAAAPGLAEGGGQDVVLEHCDGDISNGDSLWLLYVIEWARRHGGATNSSIAIAHGTNSTSATHSAGHESFKALAQGEPASLLQQAAGSAGIAGREYLLIFLAVTMTLLFSGAVATILAFQGPMALDGEHAMAEQLLTLSQKASARLKRLGVGAGFGIWKDSDLDKNVEDAMPTICPGLRLPATQFPLLVPNSPVNAQGNWSITILSFAGAPVLLARMRGRGQEMRIDVEGISEEHRKLGAPLASIQRDLTLLDTSHVPVAKLMKVESGAFSMHMSYADPGESPRFVILPTDQRSYEFLWKPKDIKLGEAKKGVEEYSDYVLLAHVRGVDTVLIITALLGLMAFEGPSGRPRRGRRC